MNRILIFDPDHGGHHFRFVQLLIEVGKESDFHVTLATTKGARRCDMYKEFLAAEESSFDLDDWIEQSPKRGLLGSWNQLRALRKSIQRCEPSVVFVPYADGLAQSMGLLSWLPLRYLPDVRIRGLLFRCGAAYSDKRDTYVSRFKNFVSARSATWYPWDRLYHLDEIAVTWYHDRQITVQHVPDPIAFEASIDRASARKTLHLADEVHVIGLVGLMSGRKGVDLLIDAFDAANLNNSCLLIAGKCDEIIRAKIDSADGQRMIAQQRLVVFDRWLDDREMFDVMVALDVVCTPYPRHIGSASILLMAAAAGKPILASEFGWVGKMVRQYQIGKVVDVTNISAFSTAIETVFSSDFSSKVSSEGMRAIARLHTNDNFKQAWKQGLN